MVNYGYGPGTDEWDDSKKERLGHLLAHLLANMNRDRKFERIDIYERPYIEVDQLYYGVRIRKMTNLSAALQEELIVKADEIYVKLMRKPINMAR